MLHSTLQLINSNLSFIIFQEVVVTVISVNAIWIFKSNHCTYIFFPFNSICRPQQRCTYIDTAKIKLKIWIYNSIMIVHYKLAAGYHLIKPLQQFHQCLHSLAPVTPFCLPYNSRHNIDQILKTNIYLLLKTSHSPTCHHQSS